MPKPIDCRLYVEDVRLARVKVIRDTQVSADKTQTFKRSDAAIERLSSLGDRESVSFNQCLKAQNK